MRPVINLFFFCTAFFLLNPVFSQKGYLGYEAVFQSGLYDLPKQAIDSQNFLLGSKGKMGVFDANKGLIVPMRYDSVIQTLYYSQPYLGYDRRFIFYKVKSGKNVGLYKFNIEAVLLIDALYDSINYKTTKDGPVFIAYRNKSKQYYDPFAERWIESLSDFEGIGRDLEDDISEIDVRLYNNTEQNHRSYKHKWSHTNYYQINNAHKNYSVFHHDKLFGVVRKSDSLEIVHASYSSIVPFGSNELRFECKQNNVNYIYDTLGKLVVPAFTIVECIDNDKKSYCVILAKGKYGLYSRSESILIAPEFSGYKLSPDDLTLIFELNGVTSYFNFKTQKFEKRTYKNLMSSFDNRYILAEEDSIIQVIDRIKGKVLKHKKYTFSQTDNRNWVLFNKDDKYLLISLKTNSEVHLQKDRIELINSLSKEVSEYASFCYLKFAKDNLFGIMDSTGRVMVEPIYDSVNYYSGWAGHNDKFTLWRHENNKTVLDAYFVKNNKWIRDVKSAYWPGKGLKLVNFVDSNDAIASIIKIGDKYHCFDESSMKIGKPIQIDSILYIGKEGCWIIRHNDSIVMWYLDKDSIIEGITDFKVLRFENREVVFLKQGNVYILAFTDFRIHQMPQIDDVYMPFDKSFQFVLQKQNKLALFSPNAQFSNFVYDDVKIGINKLIWVKMNNEWVIVE